jgi:glycosyltransferase involved in cell wall biosynthesis
MKVRCIHVITRMILGGAQENTLLTVEGLDRDPDYETTLVTGPALGPEGTLLDRAHKNGVRVITLPSMRREIRPFRDWTALRALVDLFKDKRPHIVHTHSAKAGMLGRWAAKIAKVPIIIHTVHGPSIHPNQSFLSNQLYAFLERWGAKYTDRMISVADAMTDLYVKARIAPEGKFITIHSGMEVEPFLAETDARQRVREEFGIAPDDIVIGKIARLFHLKGHEDVLNAFGPIAQKFPKAKLMFVGNGILRDELKARADALGFGDRVVFTGLVPTSRIPDMIKAMDALVHASLREGLPRVLPQALLSACPVISYALDGAPEVVLDGETGFLVPASDIPKLTDAMDRMLSDLGAAKIMALRGRELFADQFRAETMVGRIKEVYDEEMERKDIRMAGVFIKP